MPVCGTAFSTIWFQRRRTDLGADPLHTFERTARVTSTTWWSATRSLPIVACIASHNTGYCILSARPARSGRLARLWDIRLVNPDREQKSSGSETTFDRDLFGSNEIEPGFLGQADYVLAWCERA